MINNILSGIFKKNKISDLHFWEQSSAEGWKKINYPWKPSHGELVEIAKIVRDLKKPSKVALLGSTPEIRSLMEKEKIHLDVVDFSERMYLEMDKISGSKDNEMFFNSDWIEYFLGRKEVYDLVVGDLIERLLPTKRLLLLRDALNGALKQGGRLLLRSDYTDTAKRLYLKEFDIRVEIKKLKIKGLTNNEIVDWLFFGLSSYYVEDTNKISLSAMEKFLIMTKQKKILTVSELKIVNLFIDKWVYSPLNFYSRSNTQVESIWSKCFSDDARIEEQLFKDRVMALRLWQRK